MTFDEILKSKGLDEDQIESVKGEMKQNKIYTAGEENLDIRYSKLKGDHEGTANQLAEAKKLIDEMKKSEGANEALQGKIGEYEQRIEELEAEKTRIETKAALKVALLEANAEDVDYLTYKIEEKGEIALDENGKVKGIEDTIAALKTQFPNQFKSEANRKVEPNKLEHGENKDAVTPEQFKKMGYLQRTELYNSDPELYAKLNEGE